MAASDVVARRYAEAYFAVARQRKQIPSFREQLERAAGALAEERVRAALANPGMSRQQRTELALSLLDGLGAEVRNLARLLLEHGRTDIIGAVLENYDRLADREAGVVRAEVVSAVPVDDALRRRIEASLTSELGGDVRTTIRHDPSILGGLIVRIGDRVIDSSVRTRLQQLQATLA